jgi:hypothetical protein
MEAKVHPDPQSYAKALEACKLAEIADLRDQLTKLELQPPVGSVHKAHIRPGDEAWCREVFLYSPGNSGDGPENRVPLYTAAGAVPVPPLAAQTWGPDDLCELLGVKDGRHVSLGQTLISPISKARDCLKNYGLCDFEDEMSEASLALAATEDLVAWMVRMGWTPPPVVIIPFESVVSPAGLTP